MKPLLPTLIAALTLGGCAAAAEDTAPWTPAAIASAGYEATPSFSADGREMIYLSAAVGFVRWRLMRSVCTADGWSAPAPPSFAAPAPVIEADPGFTPDGRGLYFISARHDPANEDFDIYHVARDADGGWGVPERLPAPVNSPHAELLPRADAEGRLYFGSARPGGFGQGDIYVATRSAAGEWAVANVGSPVSSAANDYEAEIARDGRTLILVSDRGDRSHLYHFVRAGAGWVEKGRVPARADVFQVGPLLSPRAGKLLFAQADGARSGEIYLTTIGSGGDEDWPPSC